MEGLVPFILNYSIKEPVRVVSIPPAIVRPPPTILALVPIVLLTLHLDIN